MRHSSFWLSASLFAASLLTPIAAQRPGLCTNPNPDPLGRPKFTSPLIVFLLAIFPLGIYLVVFSQRFARLTVGVSYGVSLSALAWLVIFNAMPTPKAQPGSSSFNEVDSTIPGGLRGSGRILSLPIFAELLIAVIAFTFLVLGISISYFKFALEKGRLVAMFILTLFGGLSFGFAIILMRPGLLVPVYGANWILILVSVVVSFVILVKWTRLEMILACVTIGIFLVALAADTIIHRGQGLLIGLRILLSDDHSRFKSCYQPQITSQFIAGASQLLIPPISWIHYKYARGLWQFQWYLRKPRPPPSPQDDLEAGITKSPPYILSRHSRTLNGAQLFFSESRESLYNPRPASYFKPGNFSNDQRPDSLTVLPKPVFKSPLRVDKTVINRPLNPNFTPNSHWRI